MFDSIRNFILYRLPVIGSEKRARLIALDLMRGLFLIIIFVDHLAYSPSLFFQKATYYSSLVASAAEGFFVISGVLVGYIYGPKILKSFSAVAKKLWKRAWLLYLLTVIFTLAYTAWAYLLPEGYPRAEPYQGSVIDILFRTLTLQYQFGWADFLGRYAVFIALSPLVLWLIAKRLAWIVAAISFLVWYFYAFTPVLQFYTAWQFIFMIGVIIGYYLPVIETSIKKLPSRVKSIGWWSIVSLAAISYIATVLWIVVIAPHLSVLWLPPEYHPYFDKNSLARGRIIVGILWFTALYLVFRRYEVKINVLTKGALLLYGQNSLFVYSLQAFVIFSIDVFMPAPKESPVLLNTLVGVTGVYFTYVITKNRLLIKKYITSSTRRLLHLRE